MRTAVKACALGGIVALTLAWGVWLPAVVQPQEYHGFADRRSLFAVANAADTLSNLLFLEVGLMGIAFLRRERVGSRRFAAPEELRPYWVFFAAVSLVSAGSAYYHLAPDDARLVWDRLPMAVAFMALLAAVVGERINARAGNALLIPLVVLGVLSVVYWRASALAGSENLRPYLAVQFGSIALMLAICILFPSRYTLGAVMFLVIAIYAVAKVLETFDREIYAFGNLASGHTLKHVVAAVSILVILAALQRRTLR
jgi:ceramidase